MANEDRLTVKSEIIDGHYTLICMCGFGSDGVPDDEDACYEYCEYWGDEGCKQCEKCGIQQAFDRLAAYEDSGLTPEEINNLKSETVFLRRYIDLLCHSDSASIECLAIKADNERLHILLDELERELPVPKK